MQIHGLLMVRIIRHTVVYLHITGIQKADLCYNMKKITSLLTECWCSDAELINRHSEVQC